MAEAYAFARAFDQARYVGDDELAAVRRVEGAEDRLERRERVVGDLRLRVGDPAEERGLAGVRQPDERGIREKLQTQLVVGLLAGHADLGEPRRLAGGRGEAAVAAAADAATREHRPHTGVRQVDDEIAVRVDDLRPHRHRQLDVLAVGPVLSGPTAPAAAPAFERALSAEAREIPQVGVRGENDVAATAAVTAVGAALRDIFFPAEAQRAVAAAPRLHVNAGTVVEHGRPSR